MRDLGTSSSSEGAKRLECGNIVAQTLDSKYFLKTIWIHRIALEPYMQVSNVFYITPFLEQILIQLTRQKKNWHLQKQIFIWICRICVNISKSNVNQISMFVHVETVWAILNHLTEWKLLSPTLVSGSSAPSLKLHEACQVHVPLHRWLALSECTAAKIFTLGLKSSSFDLYLFSPGFMSAQRSPLILLKPC